MRIVLKYNFRGVTCMDTTNYEEALEGDVRVWWQSLLSVKLLRFEVAKEVWRVTEHQQHMETVFKT